MSDVELGALYFSDKFFIDGTIDKCPKEFGLKGQLLRFTLKFKIETFLHWLQREMNAKLIILNQVSNGIKEPRLKRQKYVNLHRKIRDCCSELENYLMQRQAQTFRGPDYIYFLRYLDRMQYLLKSNSIV